MSITDQLATYTNAFAVQNGVRLIAESNVTPSVVLYDAADSTPTFLDRIGVRTHVWLQTADGKVIAEYGVNEPKDLVLAGVLAVLLFAAVSLIGGAVVKGLKAL